LLSCEEIILGPHVARLRNTLSGESLPPFGFADDPQPGSPARAGITEQHLSRVASKQLSPGRKPWVLETQPTPPAPLPHAGEGCRRRVRGRVLTQGFRPGLYYFGPSGLSVQKFQQLGCRIKSLSKNQKNKKSRPCNAGFPVFLETLRLFVGLRLQAAESHKQRLCATHCVALVGASRIATCGCWKASKDGE
jgi:hypothetical protein